MHNQGLYGVEVGGGVSHHVREHHTQHPHPVAEVNQRVSERKRWGHCHGNRGVWGMMCAHIVSRRRSNLVFFSYLLRTSMPNRYSRFPGTSPPNLLHT